MNRSLNAAAFAVTTALTVLVSPLQTKAETAPSSEIALEVREVEKVTLQTKQGWAQDQNPEWKTMIDQPDPPRPDDADRTESFGADSEATITDLKLLGDSSALDELGLPEALRGDLIGKTLTLNQVAKIASSYKDDCVKLGYYLADISVNSQATTIEAFKAGRVELRIDLGRVGQMSFYDKRENSDMPKYPFLEKHFSLKQLRDTFDEQQEGDFFNYNEFYRAVFEVNARPDVTMDTDLKLRRVGETQARFADMDFFVDEHLPMHAVLEVKNTGTDATGEWRISGTLQHLNLTKHDDVLTLNAITATEFGDLLSFAGSYYRPYDFLNGGAITLYGGYSEVEADDVVPLLDLNGSGWFSGVQLTVNLINTRKHLLRTSFSLVDRSVESGTSLEGCEGEAAVVDSSEVEIMPATLLLDYSSVRPDRWGGRNFLSSQTSFNLGGSDDEELSRQRAGASSDYFIERLQAARIQPLLGRGPKGERKSQWILFLKADAQFSNAALVPVEQKAIGGMDSIRGYAEREVLGDSGFSGTVELRTPLLRLPFRKGGTEKGTADHIQFVTFCDFGEVSLEEPSEGEEESQSLLGIGAGLRMAFTSHSQLKLDWGVPLDSTETSESGGRLHASVQLQF